MRLLTTIMARILMIHIILTLEKHQGHNWQNKSSKNIGIYQEIPYSRPNKESQEDIVFLKQVPVHPRDWLA